MTYQRLPGARRGLAGQATAWLGADHILLVEGSRISEKYRRIYLRDIQALVIERRPRFVVAWPWFVLLIALSIAAATTPWAAAWLSVAAAVAGYLYVSGRFQGCRLFLATAVGNVPMGSVFRTWQARRFHDRVSAPIRAAQAEPK